MKQAIKSLTKTDNKILSLRKGGTQEKQGVEQPANLRRRLEGEVYMGKAWGRLRIERLRQRGVVETILKG